MNYIKKVGVFEYLEISFGHPLSHYEQFITDDGLFTVKNVKFNYCHIDNLISILRNTRNGVESIKIDLHIRENDKLPEILAIPHFRNVPYWHIQEYDNTDSLNEVAKMWIAGNSKVGSTFQVSVYGNSSFEGFVEHFTDRIVSKMERRVRIRTNNPDRHILLKRGLYEVVGFSFALQFFRLMMISAEMKESEYDNNCEDWIRKIDPFTRRT
ncbi:hypothetical protein B9Z55_012761 [Caenorhabditis nigoni]|uniref:F-box associated domain-containing protein n=1 Tax=Caenorhabditis nigoni TaxID=1611254 RepID=A0A2G5TZA3_9PELO|nr:hypothetical protein B9Z55_012761 [Caenorhabditis nigoni]